MTTVRLSTVSTDPILAGREVEGPLSARIRIDGAEYINFYGSRYLALSNVPEIRSEVAGALECGVPFSRQVSGGVLLASTRGAYDCILIDEGAHFNLWDAARASGAPISSFRHCDPQAIREGLGREVALGRGPLVLTDGAFATTGRLAPLAEYADALLPCRGRLAVDESHAFGVVGSTGLGAAEYCGVAHVARRAMTLSKAPCAQGAFSPCSASIAAQLPTEPPIRGANAGSPLSAVAAGPALKYFLAHPELRDRVSRTSIDLRSRLRRVGFEIDESPAPIVAFRLGSRKEMLKLQRHAFTKGVYLYYSTYIGAGPNGTLRCAVFADHTEADIDALVDALN